MKQNEKPAQGIVLNEKEPDEVNGGLRMQNEIRIGIELTDGKTPENSRGGIPVEDEALEDVSGGLRVQST